MERYTFDLKKRFYLGGGSDSDGMELYITLGLRSEDNGNHWDPDDHGSLEYSSDFSLSDPITQEAILNLCADLRSLEYYIDPCVKYPYWDTCRIYGEGCVLETFQH